MLQVGLLYGQFEGSGEIMRQLTIDHDTDTHHSMSPKGVFKMYDLRPLTTLLTLTTVYSKMSSKNCHSYCEKWVF